MVSYPFWALFEKFAPIIEIIGLIYTLILMVIGDFSAIYFLGLLLMVYLLSLMVSSFSLLYEQIAFNNYKDKKDLNRLIWIILLEPILIHPKVVLWGIKGHIDFIIGKGGWGKMIRTGFKTAEDRKNIETQSNSI